MYTALLWNTLTVLMISHNFHGNGFVLMERDESVDANHYLISHRLFGLTLRAK